MKRVCGVVLCVGLFAPVAGAWAADIGEQSEYSWTGFYLGAHGGGTAADIPTAYSDGTYWDGLGLLNAGTGAFIGYSAQVSPTWVLGIEADASWLGLRNVDYDATVNATINSMISVDARAGYLLTPRTLLYGKLGWALIGLNIPPSSYAAPGAGPRQLNGIQAGVGIETAFAPHWKTRVEAVYTAALQGYTVSGGGLGFDLRPQILSARAGIVYDFADGGAHDDIPVGGPASEWTGFYIGGHAGWAISDTREEYYAGPVSGVSWDGFGSSRANIGAFAGADMQIGDCLVAGAEVSGTWLGLRNYDTYYALLWGSVDWMVALNARVGVLASPNTLLYAKGGWALMGFTSTYPNYPVGPVSVAQLNGFQVGAGIETRLDAHWSVRVEGLFTRALEGLDFDTVPPTQGHRFRPQIISGEAGVAYRF